MNNESVVKYLIDKGADVNQKNKDGDTPLMVYCKLNNEYMVKYLVERGADINLKNNQGESPVTLTKNSNKNIYKYLLNINRENKELFIKNLKIKMQKKDYYEIVNENFYEWKIYDWNELSDRSSIYSSNFRIGKYIWRIELEKKENDTYSIYLRNMNSFEYIYMNFIFYIRNFYNYIHFKAKETSKLVCYNKSNDRYGFDSFITKSELEDKENPIVTNNNDDSDGKKIVIGLFAHIYHKDNYGLPIGMSPLDQYADMLKLNINKDSQYKVLAEKHHEWTIYNWDEFKGSFNCGSNFRVGDKYFWRIELENIDDNKYVGFYLRNMNNFEYIYVNFVFSIRNSNNYTNYLANESSKMLLFSKNQDRYEMSSYFNKEELKEKLKIKDGEDNIVVGVFLRIYEKKNYARESITLKEL